MADVIHPCGGGGFLGCHREGTELIVVQGGGSLGRLCPDCTERLEHDMRRRMDDNAQRYHRSEGDDKERHQ